jgi:hypothetical protein
MLVNLTAAKYANHFVQYVDYLANPANAAVSYPGYLDRGGSTWWALRCSSGPASGHNECSQNREDRVDAGAVEGFHRALRVMRDIFDSEETDCLVPPPQ